MITKEKLIEAGVDLDTIRDVVNGATNLNGNGSVVSRLGRSLKTIAKILATIETDGNNLIATKTTQINSLLAEIESDADFLVNDSNNRITQSINNAYAQVVTGGAPILSSESAAQLSAIEAASVTDRQIVNLKGWHTANDGGDLLLIYDAASTATVNGGTVFPGPGGSLSFDGITGAFNGTPGTGRYLALETRRLKPEQFGAKGDGVADDQPSLQRCVNYAASIPNCSIYLSPKVSYGLGATLVLPEGQFFEMYGSVGDLSIVGTAPTFIKLSNTTGIQVKGQHYLHNFKLFGKGSPDWSTTPADTETKPGIVINGRARLNNIGVAYCSGLHYGTESETTGYAVGIVQEVGGNVNYCDLTNINVDGVNDGVYIGRLPSAANNINAIKVELDNCNRFKGYAINSEGGIRNQYKVKHVASVYGAVGVFRLNGTDSEAFCQYSEGNVPVCVTFAAAARRNTVEILDIITFSAPIDSSLNTSGSNLVRSLRFNQWYGQPHIDDLSSNNYGSAFDIQQNGNVGNVTWSDRRVSVSSFGRIVNMAIQLTATQKTLASSSLAYLIWDTNVLNVQASTIALAAFPATLQNSNGAHRIYLQLHASNGAVLRFLNVVDNAFKYMTFDEVCGTGTFTITGFISLKRNNVAF